MSLIINRMIDFEKIVMEAISSSAKIKEFVNDAAELLELKSNLNATFNINQTALSRLDDSWYRDLDERILVRFTLGAAADSKFTDVFPYVDFLALLNQNFPTKFYSQPISKNNLETVEISFNEGIAGDFPDLSSRKTGSGNHPFFNYEPCSALLKAEYPRIKKEMVDSNIIGKAVIKNLEPASVKKSIYAVVNTIQPTPKTSIPEDNPTINDVIINFNSYLPGSTTQKPLPTEIQNVGAKFFSLVNTLDQLVKTGYSTMTTEDFIKNKTISDVKADASNEAKEFIKTLESLANIIPKNPTKEWSQMLSGATQLAKGISSLGGPEMGR